MRPVILVLGLVSLLASPCLLLKAREKGATTSKQLQQAVAAADMQDAAGPQGVPLKGMPEYEFYWVGNSTIAGAGLGVYARKDMPVGTLWNPEDADPDNTLAISLPMWQSLNALVDLLKAAGHSDHPLVGFWTFFDIYAYVCRDHFIVALTGNTFTNHAPEPRSGTGAAAPAPATALSRKMSLSSSSQMQPQLHSSSSRKPRQRFANSGDIMPGAPWAQGLSPWQVCTISVTLRDISAGEELLEDYFRYSPPCQGRPDACPEFMPEHESGAADSDLDDGEHPSEEWNHAVLVQLADVSVAANSSGMGGSSDLRVLAARDLAAGSVWNKEDAVHSFPITRGQWAMMLQLQEYLRVGGVHKPLVNALIQSVRSSGIYCPVDDKVYLPFTFSVLARHSCTTQGSRGSSSAGKQAFANSQRMDDSDGGLAGAVGSGSQAARCIWFYTTEYVSKGEEILVGQSKEEVVDCDWPGWRQSQ